MVTYNMEDLSGLTQTKRLRLTLFHLVVIAEKNSGTNRNFAQLTKDDRELIKLVDHIKNLGAKSMNGEAGYKSIDALRGFKRENFNNNTREERLGWFWKPGSETKQIYSQLDEDAKSSLVTSDRDLALKIVDVASDPPPSVSQWGYCFPVNNVVTRRI